VYVQHLLAQNGALVDGLLRQKKANFYVCGDAAHMAREVNEELARIISKERGVAVEEGEKVVKEMRARGSYQEDVWS
jgi:NADPH-ferrihemoprotein reductase